MNQYSGVDKVLHKLAFRSWSSQVSISGLETKAFKKKLSGIEITKPVFITSLPRAGTTLLLELCVKREELVSHTYRDMPFLGTPLFWNRFARIFKRSSGTRERAHGDGMMIDEDSPEAFEEIIWKGFWPSRYLQDRIVPWPETSYPEFEHFFREHMRKIIYLRRSESMPKPRYVSKNNLNIARVEYLKQIFPDSIIVIPYREPLQHASSLLRQHLNFLNIHKDDPFASKYMSDIGHFDFGVNLRPIDFDSWLDPGDSTDATSLSFWMQYWVNTYQFLLNNNSKLVEFISYDDICQNPEKGLENFAKSIDVEVGSFTKSIDRIETPRQYDIDTDKLSYELIDKAQLLYSKLREASH